MDILHKSGGKPPKSATIETHLDRNRAKRELQYLIMAGYRIVPEESNVYTIYKKDD